jgi:hypothetical protein
MKDEKSIETESEKLNPDYQDDFENRINSFLELNIGKA